MGFDLVIKNGTVVTADETCQADVAIQGEKVVAVGQGLADLANGAKIIDATGKLVLPGSIDVHVHLQLPFCGTVSSDDFDSGTRAAARGGVTTLIDYAIQDVENGLWAGIEKRMAEADPKVVVDYGLHSIVIKWNDAAREEMRSVIDRGVPTFKMFMVYEAEGWQSDDAALFGALTETKENGGRILVHAESEKVMTSLIEKYRGQDVGAYGHVLSRPNFIEEEAIQRAVKWTEASGGRLYVVHMSTGGGADIIKAAQARGVNVYAETCPQYLVLTDEVFKDQERGHLYATCPQVKKAADSERLWNGLRDGEVCIVSTDTCTFNTEQKAMWNGDFTKMAFGMPGTETMMPTIYTHGVKAGRFDLNHMVRLCATNPARLHGLYPKKGTIAPGSDADIAIIDPDKKKKVDFNELDTNCDWSPYQGMELAGFPDVTLCRGTVVVDAGKFVGKQGYGKFQKRTAGANL
ncbi:MAG: dihydropyrimidinase [Deltaproteobacteria bacterium]|nr:dihydropyrimidinase [Deltaproteobacteria bacterium]MBW2536196.1 dihydropyrimidinase [Deltaproteobacteria bacterium]